MWKEGVMNVITVVVGVWIRWDRLTPIGNFASHACFVLVEVYGGLGFWAHFEIKMCALCRFFNRLKRPAIHHVEINHYGTWTYYPLWQSLDAQESTELVSNQLLQSVSSVSNYQDWQIRNDSAKKEKRKKELTFQGYTDLLDSNWSILTLHDLAIFVSN